MIPTNYRGFEIEIFESTRRDGVFLADAYRYSDHRRIDTAAAYHSPDATWKILKAHIDIEIELAPPTTQNDYRAQAAKRDAALPVEYSRGRNKLFKT